MRKKFGSSASSKLEFSDLAEAGESLAPRCSRRSSPVGGGGGAVSEQPAKRIHACRNPQVGRELQVQSTEVPAKGQNPGPKTLTPMTFRTGPLRQESAFTNAGTKRSPTLHNVPGSRLSVGICMACRCWLGQNWLFLKSGSLRLRAAPRATRQLPTPAPRAKPPVIAVVEDAMPQCFRASTVILRMSKGCLIATDGLFNFMAHLQAIVAVRKPESDCGHPKSCEHAAAQAPVLLRGSHHRVTI